MTNRTGASMLLATSALAGSAQIDLPKASGPDTEPAPALRSYEVAPGRTVDGRQPGDSVDLDDNDAKRLFDLGFILGEDGSRALLTEGPTVVAGADIKER